MTIAPTINREPIKGCADSLPCDPISWPTVFLKKNSTIAIYRCSYYQQQQLGRFSQETAQHFVM